MLWPWWTSIRLNPFKIYSEQSFCFLSAFLFNDKLYVGTCTCFHPNSYIKRKRCTFTFLFWNKKIWYLVVVFGFLIYVSVVFFVHEVLGKAFEWQEAAFSQTGVRLMSLESKYESRVTREATTALCDFYPLNQWVQPLNTTRNEALCLTLPLVPDIVVCEQRRLWWYNVDAA